MKMTGFVLSQYADRFSDFCYPRFAPLEIRKPCEWIGDDLKMVKVIDYLVCVSQEDGYSTITVVLTPNAATRADVALIVYTSKLSARLEVSDWLVEQAVGLVFGHHDKRITSVEL